MKNPYNKVLKFVGLVELVDLITLNLLLGIIYLFDYYFNRGSRFETYALTYWIIYNITYFVSINVIYAFLHSSIVRPEVVVSQVGRTVLFQTVLFLTVLAYIPVPTPSIKAMLAYVLVTFAFVSAERLFIRRHIKNEHSTGRNKLNVVFLGCHPNLQPIVDIMNEKWNGYNLLGTFYDDKVSYLTGVNHLGSLVNLYEYLEHNHVDEIYCGLYDESGPIIEHFVRFCDQHSIHFFIVPVMQQFVRRRTYAKNFGDNLIFTFHPEPLSIYYNRILKRTFDIFFSGLFLCTVYPFIFTIVYLVTKITSPGPVYFRQDRTGYNGHTFRCYKFRSMKVNDKADKLQATENDSRITRWGHILRKTSIDELPQFINVFMGDMSIVGPRPHMLAHTEYYGSKISDYMVRHYIRPGVTGWAQVSGCRGETKTVADMDQRVRKDIWYIEHWTFYLDLIIIIKTAFQVFVPEKNTF